MADLVTLPTTPADKTRVLKQQQDLDSATRNSTYIHAGLWLFTLRDGTQLLFRLSATEIQQLHQRRQLFTGVSFKFADIASYTYYVPN